MPRYYKPEAVRTYISEANALKAVYAKYPADSQDHLDFIIFKTEEVDTSRSSTVSARSKRWSTSTST